MTALQRLMAQLQTLLKNLPELRHVSAGGQRHIHQVDGDDALIEAAVVLGLVGFRVNIGGQEGAAAHAGVAVALAVLIHLQLQHLLLADVVRHHPLGGALSRQTGQVEIGRALPDVVLLQHIDQLGEGRGNPYTLFVLHALVALAQGLLNNHGKILLLLLVSRLIEVHEHGDEGSLSVGGHEGHHLILDGLHAPTDFLPQTVLHHLGDGFFTGRNAEGCHFLFHALANLLPADLDKGRQMGKGNGLAAVLVGGHLGDDLGRDIAGRGEGMRLLDQGAGNDGAVLQHILQIHQIAVVHMLGIIVGVMEMDDARLVGRHDLRGQQNPAGNVLTDLACHVVPLNRVDSRVLIGVLLLDLLIVALNQAENPVVGGVGLPGQRTGVAVGDVFLGDLKGAVGHDGLLHQVLNLLHRGTAAHFLAGNLHALGDSPDLQRGHPHLFIRRFIGLGHGHDDLINVKNDFRAVAFNDFHWVLLLGGSVGHGTDAGLIIQDIVVLSSPGHKIQYIPFRREKVAVFGSAENRLPGSRLLSFFTTF